MQVMQFSQTQMNNTDVEILSDFKRSKFNMTKLPAARQWYQAFIGTRRIAQMPDEELLEIYQLLESIS
jgi:hypothetical protein